MLVGVPKEVKNHEYRVAITPAGVHELVAHGHDVVVQASAGVGSIVGGLMITERIFSYKGMGDFFLTAFSNGEFLAVHLIQCTIAVLLVLPMAFGNPNSGLPRRLLANRALVWLGLVSYGFYLWQVTIGVELGFGNARGSYLPILIGTVLLTLPLAAASYYLVERPLMRWKANAIWSRK